MKADGVEDASDHCKKLQEEWIEAEFQRLSCKYAPGGTVDTVKGALGPLFYGTVSIAGTPVKAWVDPGSSATIMSFKLFQTIGTKAAIPWEALQRPGMMLRDYSQRPILIFAQVNLEFSQRARGSLCQST